MAWNNNNMCNLQNKRCREVTHVVTIIIFLVKEHVCKEKESFYVKTNKGTCATFAVGQFK